jgi:hypothetical protein
MTRTAGYTRPLLPEPPPVPTLSLNSESSGSNPIFFR